MYTAPPPPRRQNTENECSTHGTRVDVVFWVTIDQGSHGDQNMEFHDFSMTFHDHFLRIP